MDQVETHSNSEHLSSVQIVNSFSLAICPIVSTSNLPSFEVSFIVESLGGI
jgi:hypothetical protein